MSKILRDVKKILVLAKEVQSKLKNHDGDVKHRVKKIAKLDLDELSRIEKEHGDKKLLEECMVVLKDAKETLRLLAHSENFTKVENLTDEIIKLEGHELIEISNNEKRKNDLYQFWIKSIRAKKYYHGTSNLSIPKIERYGLVPGMRPPFWRDLQRVYKLYKKAGVDNPLRLRHFVQDASGLINVGLFVTDSYPMAKRYATQSPAIWHEFIEGLNQNEARKKFLLEPFFMGKPTKECEDIYVKSYRTFYDKIIAYFIEKGMKREQICLLSKEEVYEIKRIFEKLWLEFRNQKPIILHISVLAPGIAEEEPFTEPEETKSFLYDFNTFLREFENITKGKSLEDGKKIFEGIFFKTKSSFGAQVLIKRRIPKKFIEIEFV
jgi:hypothetical protein